MSESKVYKVQSELEYQYLTEDSKVRIYLSPVRRETKKDHHGNDNQTFLFCVSCIFYSSVYYSICLQREGICSLWRGIYFDRDGFCNSLLFYQHIF